MTLLYTDPLFLQHNTGRHPECADRLRAITARLEKAGLLQQCPPGTYQPLTEEAVAQLHAPRQIAAVKQLAEHGGGHVDPDTVVSPASFRVGLAAAGACVAAVDAVLANEGRQPPVHRTALCLVRPPGHHATPTRSMGFCLFNNIALAAHHAKRAHGLTRILIVDWDVHHGNGTQEIFWADPSVVYLSTHRFPFYPGTGREEERGAAGNIVNLPFEFGTSRRTFLDRFVREVRRVGREFRPEWVLVSCGFDAFAGDPIGGLGLEPEDYRGMTEAVRELGTPVVSALEGGYALDALGACAEQHVLGLLD